MIVADTSALIEALVSGQAPVGLRERLADEGTLEAPHLVDLEFLNALRRMVRLGEMSDDQATDARSLFAELSLTRYPHAPLADRIWELRDNLSAYDAAFIALAEALGAPLVTCDAALAKAPAHRAKVELYAGN